jgi:hypothetical protein
MYNVASRLRYAGNSKQASASVNRPITYITNPILQPTVYYYASIFKAHGPLAELMCYLSIGIYELHIINALSGKRQ